MRAAESTPVPQLGQSDRIEDVQAKLQAALARNSDLEKIVSLLNVNIQSAKSPLKQKYNEALIAQYDHQIATMKQIEAVYAWQGLASNVSLFLVVLIVSAGVAFSGFQLWHAAKLGAPQADSHLEITFQKVRLTSSVVGIVVLALSFFFFYLFVKEIYAIKLPAFEAATEAKP
jgi:hypothetical protein